MVGVLLHDTSNWLKPIPCVPGVQELIGMGEGRELRVDIQVWLLEVPLLVSPQHLPRNWKATLVH